MLLYILIAAFVVFLGLIVLAYICYWRMTRAAEQLFGRRQKLARLEARHEKAVEQARIAEQRWQIALQHLEMSLGRGRHVLPDNARTIHDGTEFVLTSGTRACW